MRAHDRLQLLVDVGAIEEVIRPLMAGKEAEVFLVRYQGEPQVAKLYKHAEDRSFKHRADYTEGRKVRSTRSARAIAKRSRFGREEEEEAWRATEVDMLYRAQAAGVRVPDPLLYQDGVLIMELVTDGRGEPAPRLVDVRFDRHEAERVFLHLVGEAQRLLCAGIVHGDLSDFNVLMTPDGPVVIDFPQAVDPAHNNNARRLLIRDVRNLASFLGSWAPRLKGTRYGEEMWALYEKNSLDPETRLTGRFREASRRADVRGLLDEIADVAKEESRRRAALGLGPIDAAGETPEEQAERSRVAREESLAALERIKAQREAKEAQAAAPRRATKDGEGPRKRRRRGKGGPEATRGGPGQPKPASEARPHGKPRQQAQPRPPGKPRQQAEPRPPGKPRQQAEARPPGKPRQQTEPRPPRAEGQPGSQGPAEGEAPRRRRRRRGPRRKPDGASS